jgi:hypothetical protein
VFPLLLAAALQILSDDEARILAPGPLGLLRDGAWMAADERDEALADVFLLHALARPPGEERKAWAAKAEPIYAVLAAVTRVRPTFSEDQLRKLWKRTRALFEVAPEKVVTFFETMMRRGIAPGWDADERGRSEWGWKDRFERLRLRR